MKSNFSKLLYIAFAITLYSCGSYNTNTYSSNPVYTAKAEPGMPSGPGCYAKCLISEKYTVEIENIFEYTGDNYDSEWVEEVSIEVKPATSKWIKKKADPSCISSNPDDCLVWCLVDQEAEYENYYIVNDTSKVKDYKESSIRITKGIEKGGFTQWKEIVCEKDQTSDFYTDIQLALTENNYDLFKAEYGVFDKTTKQALIKFQKENYLPIGNLDLETIAALGIEY